MNNHQLIQAQPGQFAWVTTLIESESGTKVDCTRWPVIAWDVHETTIGTLAQPVLPIGVQLDGHVGLESADGEIYWNHTTFSSHVDFAAACVAGEWGID